MKIKWDKVAIFVGGMLFATKGIEALGTDKAHKAYVSTAAAALRGRDEVMKNVTLVREECGDIYAEAVELNEKKAEEKALKAASAEADVIEDQSDR